MRLRRIAVVLGIDLLLLLGVVIVFELCFGYWFSPLGVTLMRGTNPGRIERIESPFYPAGTTITSSRGQFGFRGLDADPARSDILAVGSSTTAERYHDDRDTWTAQLQDRLGRDNCPTIIANAGVEGFSTVGIIESFNGWFDRVPGLKPRFVMARLGITDAGIDPHSVWRANFDRYPTSWHSVEHYLAAHSGLHRAFEVARGLWRGDEIRLTYGPRIKPPAEWEPVTLPPDFAALAAERAQGFRQRLAALTEQIHAFGSRPIYLTEQRSDGRQVDGQWQQLAGSQGAQGVALVAALNEATLDFCRDTGEICIDLAGRIDLAPREYADAFHTTPAGSAHVARFLAEALTPILCREPRR